MNNPDVTEKLNAPAASTPASGSDYLCQSERESWDCPHMKEVSSPTDMRGETYRCQKPGCTRRYRLDYDEMR